MKRLMGFALLAVLPLVLGGCLELRQDATLNPDGSGKAVVDLLMPDLSAMLPMGGDPSAAKPDPDVQLKKFAKGVMDNSEGAEAWSDVSVGLADDGRMKFKGTAYFKDIGKLKVSSGKEAVVGSGGLSWAKSEKGGMVLAMDPNADAGPQPPAAKPKEMTDEELAKAVQTLKMQWPGGRATMGLFIGKLKVDLIFHLPGAVAETAGFNKQPDGSVQMSIDGQKILDVMDKLMADEAYLRACVLAGRNPVRDKNPVMMEKVFGTRGPLTARVTGDLKPAFDYAKEVKAAKDAYPAMIKKLGLDNVPADSGPDIKITPKMGSSTSYAPAKSAPTTSSPPVQSTTPMPMK